jgi:hypothetical protein
MIPLLEAQDYPADELAQILAPHYITHTAPGKGRVNYVGYINDPAFSHSVMLLPKVFLKAGLVFGQFTPLALLRLHTPEGQATRTALRTGGYLDFLFRFSVWLYRAIRQFRARQPNSTLTEEGAMWASVGAGERDASELEAVMALLQFNRENQSLLTFVRKYNTAQRQTVSWGRTLNRQQAIWQDGQPVYVAPVVKQKTINADEELIVLFISTLAHIRNEYGFRLDLNPLYRPLPTADFNRFRDRATRRLREIRGRYFTDSMVRLWAVLHRYYAQQETMRGASQRPEFLLVRDFNIVFEDMIDSLLSDTTEKAAIPAILKEQRDGKRVDHLYAYADLVTQHTDQIYHIGDSKYYQTDGVIGAESVYKQFTYARNVIQANIDLLNEHKPLPGTIRYRDQLTEGYNPTPNFFISALVNPSLDFGQPDLCFRGSYNANYHFPGRLFDRDTLLLQAYDINFLFVLSAYIAPHPPTVARFRADTRARFRQKLIKYLNDKYELYKLTFNDLATMEQFVTQHFRELSGQMYRPSGAAFSRAILVAKPKNEKLALPDTNLQIERYYLSSVFISPPVSGGAGGGETNS